MKEKKMAKAAMSGDKCIWMKAGVINHKLCPYNFACNLCAFDKAMKDAGRIESPQKRRVPWTERMRKLSGPEKYCRHMLQGLVSYKLCPMNYECGKCKYDQMIQDTIHDATEPRLRRVAGFDMPMNYHFHHQHAWVNVEYGGKCRVGFDDFSTKVLGEQRTFKMPRIGHRVAQNQAFMSVKTASREFELEAPIDGVISAVNPLQDHPDELQPYSDGWVVFIDPTPKMPVNLKKLHYGDTALEFMTKSSDKLIETLSPGLSLSASGGIIAPEVFTSMADEMRIALIENVLLGD